MTETDGASIRELVLRYFDAMSRYEPEAAAACFTEEGRYSHPPYPGGIGGGFDRGPNERVEVQGRENILELLRARGDRKVKYDITSCLSDGNVTLVEGYAVSADQGSGAFVASLRISPDGLIERYTPYR